MERIQYDISCLCGATQQRVSSLSESLKEDAANQVICHCWDCRHSTGVLCSSYLRIGEPSLKNTGSYSSSDITRYFCSTCGCHCFRSSRNAPIEWTVATGIISGEVLRAEEMDFADFLPRHQHVDSTIDGGISVWMQETGSSIAPSTPDSSSTSTSLSARCHCNNVSFQITRPDQTSTQLSSYFPDLMIPYKNNSPEATNPSDDKWWLRDKNRYMAGNCACRSCRLASGFEIQSWVFVPRSNILFQGKKLDFPVQSLRSYESSSGVSREFCARCGATVFWHDTTRPELIDVSVGLLETNGVRAEKWLDWWTTRVSFAEDARLGRWGSVAQKAEELVQRLEAGMRETSC